MNNKPPRWALRFLSWYCPDSLYESIDGDLTEQFEQDTKIYGVKKARLKFAYNVLRFFRPGILLRNKFSMTLNSWSMLQNYIKVMKRNVLKHKFHSLINIFGLVAGITFALFVGFFIQHELQVNQQLKDVDRLYLVQSKYEQQTQNFAWFAPAPLVKQTIAEYPTLFENYYRFWDRQITVSKGDQHFRIQGMIGDSTLIDMFGFDVKYGDPVHALQQPGSIVITEKIARQFFGKTNVVGEVLALTTERSGIRDFEITAVLTDLEAKNSVSDFMNMDAQIFLPMESHRYFSLNDVQLWPSDIITYLKLQKGVAVADAQRSINKVLQKYAPGQIREKRTLVLNPLSDYYLVTNHGAVQKQIVSLEIIAIFILLLAVANFINITIASSFARLKEIGVRKVIGGVKHQVTLQFIAESVAMAVMAGVLSLVAYELLRGYAGHLLEVTLPSWLKITVYEWLTIIIGIFCIGLLAGIYPAIYLSTTSTIQSLKGKFRSVQGALRFSRGLMALQFLIATFVFIVSMVMSRQVTYFLEKDLGYTNGSVLIVSSVPRVWSDEGMDRMESAKKEFERLSSVETASLSWGAPGWNLSPLNDRISPRGIPAEQGIATTITCTDEAYSDVYDLKLIEGQFLNQPGHPRVANTLVLNESAVKMLKVNVGDEVTLQGGQDQVFTIAGVVKDFHFESLHEAVKPLAIMHNRDFQAYRYLSFKLAPGNMMQAVDNVEQVWKRIFPNDPFVYTFSDEKLQALYKTEFQLKKASAIATGLMIIIVVTGVLGLVSLNVAKRTKEMGVRKVLGASSTTLFILIAKEYTWIMIAAFLTGVPLSYYFINEWLSGFAYHIDLTGWMFIAPVSCLFAVTIVVICLQSIKALVSNPVKALRYE